MSKNILLVSDTMIKEKTALHGNVDPKLLYPDIKVAQDMYIHPLLGSELYDKIQSDIENGTVSGDYKTLLDEYVVDCLIYYVLADLPTTISFQFWNKGVIRKQGESTELPSMSDLVDISNKYRIRAEFYGNRLTKYLKENAAAKFQEYLNPGNGVDDISPINAVFSLPIYLGDDSDCPKTLSEKYQGNKPRC